MLANIDFMRLLPDAIIEEFTYRLHPENFDHGACIFKAGHSCTEILLVSEGEVEVNLVTKGVARTLEVIGQGSCIGTYSVLNMDNY